MSILPGTYLHYKGNQYEVTGIAKHSETEEEFVVYFASKNPEQLWVRPLSMFSEEIEINADATLLLSINRNALIQILKPRTEPVLCNFGF